MATGEQQPTSEFASGSAGTSAFTSKFARDRYSGMGSYVAALVDGRIRVRLLQGFRRHERDAILSAASYRHFAHNSVVLHQGDPADRLFLLIKGSARFFFITPDGRKVYLHWLAPGEVFGGASLLTYPANFLVSTEVSKGTHVLVWQRNVAHRLVKLYPRLLENALSVGYDYLVWYLASHLSLVCHTAHQRLAYVLASLADGIGHKYQGGVRLDITNEQLANTANITLFTVSRFLSEFRRTGAILKSRGKIVVCRPERLFPDPEK
jgi:CRP-like cAMP-binding protein